MARASLSLEAHRRRWQRGTGNVPEQLAQMIESLPRPPRNFTVPPDRACANCHWTHGTGLVANWAKQRENGAWTGRWYCSYCSESIMENDPRTQQNADKYYLAKRSGSRWTISSIPPDRECRHCHTREDSGKVSDWRRAKDKNGIELPGLWHCYFCYKQLYDHKQLPSQQKIQKHYHGSGKRIPDDRTCDNCGIQQDCGFDLGG